MEIFQRGELAIFTVNFKDEDGNAIQPTDVYAYIYEESILYTYGEADYLGQTGEFEYRWEIPIGVNRGIWHIDFQAVYAEEDILERNEFKIKHSGLD